MKTLTCLSPVPVPRSRFCSAASGPVRSFRIVVAPIVLLPLDCYHFISFLV